MDDLTVCLMTCGEETEAECLRAVQSWRHAVVFQEVRGITPAYKALNQMFAQCNTKYLIPLDADMILNGDAYERIVDKLGYYVWGNDWHSILFPLWDVLTQEKIYALKLFHMEVMRHIPYKDDPCPDIQHYKDLKADGLMCYDFFEEEPIGQHVVRGNFYCYAKYRDLYLTARSRPRDLLESHFKGGKNLREKAKRHHDFFMDQYNKTGNEDYLYCIGGMLEGLKASLTYKSKDLSERWMAYPDNQSEQFLEWYKNNKTHRVFA